MDSTIAGHTKTVCLLGHPVAHSLSPQIHNHAFRSLGLPYVYIALDVLSQNLQSAIYTVRSSMAGANVTIPHKKAALHYCDEISELSAATGTVNTLYIRDGRLCGTTTDPIGFYKALEYAGHVLKNDHVIILGNGGTAKTLGAALLLDKKCASLTIAARSEEKAQALTRDLKSRGSVAVDFCKLNSEESIPYFKRCSLLVNCTSVGMHPHIDQSPVEPRFFHNEMTVFDAIYNPRVTRILEEAAQAGCRTQNGLPMLLFQGLESFRYWTGKEVNASLFDMEQLQSFVDKR